VAEKDSTIRVFLADEHSLFREAVRAVLEDRADLEVVGEAADGVQAIVQAEELRPDLVVVGTNLGGFDIAEIIRSITSLGCRVLVLLREDDNAILLRAVEAGAHGFVANQSPLTELIRATRSVFRGEMVVPGHMLASLLAGLMRQRDQRDEILRRMAPLTRREREVLALLAEGANNESIAVALVISPQTVRTHIQNILVKLGVHSRLEAAALVMENGVFKELMGTMK
jgi:DNA-binding NarL/FixJ family response regulator